MHATFAHLVCLLMRGTLQRDMINCYNNRSKKEPQHEFLTRFVFYTSPSHIVTRFADLLIKRFLTASPEERRLDISFTLENLKHIYSVCPPYEYGEISIYVVSRELRIFWTRPLKLKRSRRHYVQLNVAESQPLIWLIFLKAQPSPKYRQSTHCFRSTKPVRPSRT